VFPRSAPWRIVFLAIRALEFAILTSIALLVVRYLALPIFLPLYVPVALLLVAGLESVAQVVARRHAATLSRQSHTSHP
jgi:hypothetical protein